MGSAAGPTHSGPKRLDIGGIDLFVDDDRETQIGHETLPTFISLTRPNYDLRARGSPCWLKSDRTNAREESSLAFRRRM